MKLSNILVHICCCVHLTGQSFTTPQFTTELGGLCQFTTTNSPSKYVSEVFSMGLGAMFNINYNFYNNRAISSGVRYSRYNPIFKANSATSSQYFHTHIINVISIPLSYKVEKNLSLKVKGFVSLGTEMTCPINIVEFPVTIDRHYTLITYDPPKFSLGIIVDVGVKYPIGCNYIILSTTLNRSIKGCQIANYSYLYENNNHSAEILFNYSYFSVNLLYSLNISNTVKRCNILF